MKTKKLLTKKNKKNIRHKRTIRRKRNINLKGGDVVTNSIYEKAIKSVFTSKDLYTIISLDAPKKSRCLSNENIGQIHSLTSKSKIISEKLINIYILTQGEITDVLHTNIYLLESILQLKIIYDSFMIRNTQTSKTNFDLFKEAMDNIHIYQTIGISNIVRLDEYLVSKKSVDSENICNFNKTLLAISIVHRLLCNIFGIKNNTIYNITSESIINIIFFFFQKDYPVYNDINKGIYQRFDKLSIQSMYYPTFMTYSQNTVGRLSLLQDTLNSLLDSSDDKNLYRSEISENIYYKFFALLYDYSLIKICTYINSLNIDIDTILNLDKNQDILRNSKSKNIFQASFIMNNEPIPEEYV
jgi:hypothetical protein